MKLNTKGLLIVISFLQLDVVIIKIIDNAIMAVFFIKLNILLVKLFVIFILTSNILLYQKRCKKTNKLNKY